jgi:phosphomannomutase
MQVCTLRGSGTEPKLKFYCEVCVLRNDSSVILPWLVFPVPDEFSGRK